MIPIKDKYKNLVRTRHSAFLSKVAVKITWRRPEVKFGRNVVKEETTQKKKKNTKMRKKSPQ